MPVLLRCPDCQKLLKVKEELAGKKVKCPNCGKPVRVPAEELEVMGVEEVVDVPAEAASSPPAKDIPVSAAEVVLPDVSSRATGRPSPPKNKTGARPDGLQAEPTTLESIDDPDQPIVKRVPFPGMVGFAGAIWIFFGLIVLLGTFLVLGFVVLATSALESRATANRPEPTALYLALFCPLALWFFFGAVFLYVGIQSVLGKATDTLGNGIGSILIGLLSAAWGCSFLAAYLDATKRQPSAPELLLFAVGIMGFFVLSIAGVLALAGRSQYKAWRKAEKAARQQMNR